MTKTTISDFESQEPKLQNLRKNKEKKYSPSHLNPFLKKIN